MESMDDPRAPESSDFSGENTLIRDGRLVLLMADHRPELAEALGVFFLVLVGCGAIMMDATTGALGAVGVSLAFGFVIVILVYAMGHVCGAHYNPAITLAFALTGHFPWRRVPTYLLAQLVGATAAAFLLRALLGDVAFVGSTMPAAGVAPWVAFVVEGLATFLLALVIIGVATDKRAAPGVAGLAIGGAVLVDALAFGGLTGASMNPARSLGPALASGDLSFLWLYLLAPCVGAGLSMLLYEYLRAGRLGIAAREPLGALGPIVGLEAPE
jgi:MIP family channel proteins